MRQIPFLLLDVFADRPFTGNQLCVVVDGTPLTDGEMQSIARETNLSETTFVLPPTVAGATYRNRIFTPGGELPFAGHPTLGTAAALAMVGRLAGVHAVQESLSGLTPITLELGPGGGVERAVMQAPEPELRLRPDPAAVAAALGVTTAAVTPRGLAPAVVRAGVSHLLVPVSSPEALAALRPNTSALAALSQELGVIGAYPFTLLPAGARALARARLFAPLYNIPEDPATGSAAAPLGHYLNIHGLLPESADAGFSYEQGVEMGRPSEVWVQISGRSVRVGGRVRLMGEGHFRLD